MLSPCSFNLDNSTSCGLKILRKKHDWAERVRSLYHTDWELFPQHSLDNVPGNLAMHTNTIPLYRRDLSTRGLPLRAGPRPVPHTYRELVPPCTGCLHWRKQKCLHLHVQRPQPMKTCNL